MVDMLWRYLYSKYDIVINFAYTTFAWDSEASLKAHVFCVIVGFSNRICEKKEKLLYIGSNKISCSNINPYLMNAPTIFLERRTTPLSSLPHLTKGSQLVDGGFYIFETNSDYDDFITKEPNAKVLTRKYLNAKAFLNNKEESHVLYFENSTPDIIKTMPLVMERIQKVKKYREESSSPTFNKLAERPTKYFVTLVPKNRAIAFPCVSSENRKYIPIGFIDAETVCTNAMFYIESQELYIFALLNSNVHMSWMRVFSGRLKGDYRYSSSMVYNTLPVPNLSLQQKERLEKTAKDILNARAKYPDSSLADLYDDAVMPPELRKAHQANDKAVMEAYGFWGKLNSESECVAELMKMYTEITKEAK